MALHNGPALAQRSLKQADDGTRLVSASSSGPTALRYVTFCVLCTTTGYPAQRWIALTACIDTERSTHGPVEMAIRGIHPVLPATGRCGSHSSADGEASKTTIKQSKNAAPHLRVSDERWASWTLGVAEVNIAAAEDLVARAETQVGSEGAGLNLHQRTQQVFHMDPWNELAGKRKLELDQVTRRHQGPSRTKKWDQNVLQSCFIDANCRLTCTFTCL